MTYCFKKKKKKTRHAHVINSGIQSVLLFYLVLIIIILHDSKKSKPEIFYLKCKITLYTIYLPKFKTIHYVILFTRRVEKINKVT